MTDKIDAAYEAGYAQACDDFGRTSDAIAAEAWDRGFRQGESFANHGTDNTTNPYRALPLGETS